MIVALPNLNFKKEELQMNKRFWIVAVLMVIAVALAGCSGAPSDKPVAKAGSVEIYSPWIRAAKSGDNTAAYMVLKNTAGTADKLVKAEFANAGMVELMITTMKDDKMQMETVMELEVPANGENVLKSGGNHVMLMMLNQDLNEGDTTQLTLTFASGNSATFDLPIKSKP